MGRYTIFAELSSGSTGWCTLKKFLGTALTVSFLFMATACAAPSSTEDPAVAATSEQPFAEVGPDLGSGLAELVEAVNAEHGGITGVAVSHADGVDVAGLKGENSAWSTIKVPIAIAASQAGTATDWLIDASIAQSDNPSTTELWNTLGGDIRAAHAVEQVMWRAGGPGNVRYAVTHYEGGPFGNSVWTLESQAAFAEQLPCIDDAEKVYASRGEIAEWQDDGIGRLDGARFKGGWSEEEIHDGEYAYTYRQFGTVPAGADGIVGLAVLAHPEDGAHETAAEMLDDLARGIGALVEEGVVQAAPTCGEV